MRKYDLWDFEDKDYRINCFEKVGWVDPFPRDNLFKSNTKKPDNIETLVYATSRYKPGEPPQVVYVPRREMMFKMMRACIDVKEIEDLWISKSSD